MSCGDYLEDLGRPEVRTHLHHERLQRGGAGQNAKVAEDSASHRWLCRWAELWGEEGNSLEKLGRIRKQILSRSLQKGMLQPC